MKRIDVVKKRDGWAGESCGRTVPGEAQGQRGPLPTRRRVASPLDARRLATKPGIGRRGGGSGLRRFALSTGCFTRSSSRRPPWRPRRPEPPDRADQHGGERVLARPSSAARLKADTKALREAIASLRESASGRGRRPYGGAVLARVVVQRGRDAASLERVPVDHPPHARARWRYCRCASTNRRRPRNGVPVGSAPRTAAAAPGPRTKPKNNTRNVLVAPYAVG